MIDSISLANTASYSQTPQVLKELKCINYIFGANGTGKTTISRVIANYREYPACTVAWKDNTPLDSFVYNSDYVNRNFNQSVEIPGVFTLGQDSIELERKITELKNNLETARKDKARLLITLKGNDNTNGKTNELAQVQEAFRKACWNSKLSFGELPNEVFRGFHSDSKRFVKEVLHRHDNNDDTVVESFEHLKEQAEKLFSNELNAFPLIRNLQNKKVLGHENNSVLQIIIVGRQDINIASMIEHLDNYGWVNTGRHYFEQNNGICPFCQQKTTDQFRREMEKYFDEQSENNKRLIEELRVQYERDATLLVEELDDFLSLSSDFLDKEQLRQVTERVKLKLDKNSSIISKKQDHPHQRFELDSLERELGEIESILETTNNEISAHNDIVHNVDEKRMEIKSKAWRLVTHELGAKIDDHLESVNDLESAISSLNKKISEKDHEIRNITQDIQILEQQVTGVDSTVTEINELLLSLGFNGFKLKVAGNSNAYKIVRNDGQDAKETLSEGEKAFVTFLYFHQSLKGSHSPDGTTSDRVVVFDDPVSSLDADILFIVCRLIKGSIEEAVHNTGNIKQVFVLTHNIYFHKEVTFDQNRGVKNKRNSETFWIVRKLQSISEVEYYEYNPIRSSYELLWSEIKGDKINSLTIRNTMRRILEYYFKMLGSTNLKDLPGKFEGQDKMICNSLISWLQSGSHDAGEDLYVSTTDSEIQRNKVVFQQIFVKTGHEAHYQMMMRET